MASIAATLPQALAVVVVTGYNSRRDHFETGMLRLGSAPIAVSSSVKRSVAAAVQSLLLAPPQEEYLVPVCEYKIWVESLP